MNDEVLKTLKKLLQEYGEELCTNRQKLEGLLKDFCDRHRREISVLTAAAGEGIAEELRRLSGAEVDEFAFQRLVKRLHENGGIDEQYAEWAVRGWALALGKKPPKSSGGRSSSPAGAHRKSAGPSQIPEGFVYVEGGRFMMGSPGHEPGRYSWESPLHEVTVDSFYMSKHEVTQEEYRAVTGKNPSLFKGDDCPAENVSWYDAVRYCIRRSRQEGLNPAYRIDRIEENDNVQWDRAADGYRLPTEAEWEFAARGGNWTEGYLYAGSDTAGDAGWYEGNSGGRTHPVGEKAPNELGLYDMSGNVWEWCWDWYGDYSSGSQRNPGGPSSGSDRVIRGGSWDFSARNLRSADRHNSSPGYSYGNLGFRLVRREF